jgi:glycolate oxidase FAD binding subunit
MTTRPVWLASLETLVGAHRCEAQTTLLHEYAIDGLIPRVVVWPETAEQVSTVLQWAEREKLAVIPCGSRTKIGLGEVPRRFDVALSMRRLSQTSDYDVANFTITAGAGMTFAQLTQLTAAHMQMLPLQYPFSTATLGGLIATNAYTPKRLRYGGVRDLLLGLRIALPSGEIAHFGGKVVKNVAGYDMCKLFLGSLGTLGIIVEVTFRLYAVPERDDTLLAWIPSLTSGSAAVAQLMATQLLPSQILLIGPIAAQAVVPDPATQGIAGTALLLVNCEGMDEAVERQLAEVTRICQGHGASSVQVLSGERQLQLRHRLEAVMLSHPSQPLTRVSMFSHNPDPGALLPLTSGEGRGEGSSAPPPVIPHPNPLPEGEGTKSRPQKALEGEGASEGSIVLRLGTLPSRVSTVMETAAQVLKPLASGPMIIGDCGMGLVNICLGPEGLTTGAIDAPLLGALRDLAGVVAGHGGFAVVETAPPEAKTQLEVWGSPPSSFPLLKALKHQFDPERVLSPGRFIGGL